MANTKTFYNSPADHWVKAQPLGNGSIGAMVFGGVKSEKISLNHDTMWSGRPRKIDFEGKHEQFLKARELTFAGRYAEATEIIEKHCLIGGVESYMAFGDMDIDFNLPEAEITDYCRVLDMENAVHTTSFRCGGISYKRECLVSYPDDVLMMKITSDGKKAVSLTIHLSSELRSHTYSKGDTLYLKGELPRKDLIFTPVRKK